jgi:hypothetical protein
MADLLGRRHVNDEPVTSKEEEAKVTRIPPFGCPSTNLIV